MQSLGVANPGVSISRKQLGVIESLVTLSFMTDVIFEFMI